MEELCKCTLATRLLLRAVLILVLVGDGRSLPDWVYDTLVNVTFVLGLVLLTKSIQQEI
jgi:hypothetical protein